MKLILLASLAVSAIATPTSEETFKRGLEFLQEGQDRMHQHGEEGRRAELLLLLPWAATPKDEDVR
jgi:hypothetical protein